MILTMPRGPGSTRQLISGFRRGLYHRVRREAELLVATDLHRPTVLHALMNDVVHLNSSPLRFQETSVDSFRVAANGNETPFAQRQDGGGSPGRWRRTARRDEVTWQRLSSAA